MRPFLFSLAALGVLSVSAGIQARDPGYQDRHFRHYGLYDYYLQQDFGRREYFGGPPGYIAPEPVRPYRILERPYEPVAPPVYPYRPGAVAPPRPDAVPPVDSIDPGYSYYREWKELDLARQLIPTQPEAAKRRLREIIAKYPGTRAAAEAARLLSEMP